MSFLHSHDILHRDLNPSNILLDDNYYPKISDFGLSKRIHTNEDSKSYQSSEAIKGTKKYLSPEIIKDKNYTKAGDVYAFGIIVYELKTNLVPFKELPDYSILYEIVNGRRPIFEEPIDDAYHDLIVRCWSQDPNNRPTFDDIVNELKNNPKFITRGVNKDDFLDYVDFIDEYKSTYDTSKMIINISGFLNDLNNKLKNIKKFDLKGFNFIKSIKIENDEIASLAQNEIEKVVVRKLIPPNDDVYESYINYIQSLNKYKPHKNVGIFKGISFKDLNEKRLKYPLIIHEFDERKSLYDFINAGLLTDVNKMILLYGIAKEMMKMHENNEIQKNLLPKSILINEKYQPMFSKAIIDNIDVSNLNTNTKEILLFSAPEFFEDDFKNYSEKYSKESDIYSFGILMNYVLTGKIPNYNYFDSDDFYKNIKYQNQNKNLDIRFDDNSVPSHFYYLIVLLCDKIITNRPSFRNIVDLFENGVVLPSILKNRNDLNTYKNYTQKSFNLASLNCMKKNLKSTNPNQSVIIDFLLADQYNDPESQVEIGKLYYYKDFSCLSKEISLNYFQKAALQNHPEALFYIGQAYLNGIVYSKNKEIAMSYFSKSSSLGFKESIDFVRKIELTGKYLMDKQVIVVGSLMVGKSAFVKRLINFYNTENPKTI